jgi:DUF1680 family protein
MHRSVTLIASAVICSSLALAQQAVKLAAQPFTLGHVRLLDGPFKRAMEKNQEYLLSMDVDRMLWPYHEHAGMPTKGERYGGWARKDCVGQISGHYLSALSMMYLSSGKAEYKKRVDYMVTELAKIQKKYGNGYLGPVRPEVWKNTFDGSIEVHAWGLGGGYVPWYVMHKTYAGLIDAYQLAGNELALKVVRGLADWAKRGTDKLSEEQFQKMLLCEHGGMAESMADLHAITGKADYLVLAKRFEHKQITDPLAQERDELTGKHVNTQLPKILAAARLFELTGDQRHATVANFLWRQTVDKRAFATGGVDLREHYFAPGKEAECLSWNSAETCAVYNMLKLTRHLFGWKPEARLMDYYERALYNQILGSQDPETGGFTYFYSLRPGHFKIYSTPFDSMWCCVGTGMENHSKYGDTIYSHNGDTLWVNLFIPSEVDWQQRGVKVRQETKFPDRDVMNFTISMPREQKFTMKFRVPYWAKSGASIWLNGQRQTITATPQSYLTLSRTWKNGDIVKLQLPMSVHLHRARDNADMAVVMYGPLTLAGELGNAGLPNGFVHGSQAAHSGMMAPPVPRLLFGSKALHACVKRVDGDVLRFRTVAIGSPTDVTLVPLHALHHQRYTVYWDTKKAPAGISLKPSSKSASDLQPGLDYEYYHGAWTKLPDFAKLKVVQRGVVDGFDISKRKQDNEFGFVFSGYLKIPTDGDYYFATKSDDGSAMTLAGTEILRHDGIHALTSKSTGPLSLVAGFYSLEFTYFEGGGGEGLEVQIYDGKGGWQRIPRDMLFRSK